MSAVDNIALRELFPHGRIISAGATSIDAELALKMLEPLMSDTRVARMEAIARERTYSVVPVLENLFDRGNASAVMRTAEALGFQRVDIIEPGDRFKKANRVTKGADKWLDVFQWRSTPVCIEALRNRGYAVYSTHFDAEARPIDEVDFSRPTALIFGNEKDGVSSEARSLSDGGVVIPMRGFVQSFNISVAAALCLYHAYRDRTQRLGRQGDLEEDQVRILRACFAIRSTRTPERLIQRLLARLA